MTEDQIKLLKDNLDISIDLQGNGKTCTLRHYLTQGSDIGAHEAVLYIGIRISYVDLFDQYDVMMNKLGI